MMNKLFKNFRHSSNNSAGQFLSKDDIAELLRISPEALTSFEAAYAKQGLDHEPEDFFSTNSRQAANAKHITPGDASLSLESTGDITDLKHRIVNELLDETAVYVFDGTNMHVERPKALPAGEEYVQKSEIEQLPAEIRPQLSGKLMKKDIPDSSYPAILGYYKAAMTAKNPKQRKDAYNHFRQGLDILDLDPITYEMIGSNPNSMGHWFPQLANACQDNSFFKIPATAIVKVPLTLLQLTRQPYGELTQTTLDIVNEWAKEAFKLKGVKDYFIKTGTYSSKFDFRNCHVHGEKEVNELGEYLLFIHHQALQMASPLCQPSIYGVSTTNEWVVRDFIPDKENNPCIYKGLPLHTEYRVFVDCDSKEVIGFTPYWESKTMKQRFGHEADADSPHQLHDYVIYSAHEKTLTERYDANIDRVLDNVKDMLSNMSLTGQWSIDIMQNGEDFWIIDMALAENSAFYECVPNHLRKPSRENWIPELPSVEQEKLSLDNLIQAAESKSSSSTGAHNATGKQKSESSIGSVR